MKNLFKLFQNIVSREKHRGTFYPLLGLYSAHDFGLIDASIVKTIL